jgi:hypothetical protein
VQNFTAVSLNQGNHDGNPWFSTLLQHPSIKEIMMETHGSVPYCSNPRSRISLLKPMVQYLTAATLDQGNHDRRFPWSRVAAVRYWTKGFHLDFLDWGILQYSTAPRVSIMISLIEVCCSKVLNQGFLSWFPWSRDAAVRYWTKGFYHDFGGRGMLQ